MQFAFRDAPEWFYDHLIKYYIDELHSIQLAGKKVQNTTTNNLSG